MNEFLHFLFFLFFLERAGGLYTYTYTYTYTYIFSETKVLTPPFSFLIFFFYFNGLKHGMAWHETSS
ncbi:hypothetical protein GGR50DRAFT_638309 [Xylaria sp. CBS 124048]|nr:hypothetical protein GGR50DRAFT_638309 [Xylaria sp. CBS 124048]